MPTRHRVSEFLVRRIREFHLFAGLFVSPFVLVFAISAILLNHTWAPWEAAPEIEVKTARNVEVRKDMDGLGLAKSIMEQLGVSGEVEFFSYRPQHKRIEIPVMKPGQRVDITVNVEDGTAEIKRRKTGVWDTLHYLHKSPGPHLKGFRGNWGYTRLWGWLSDIAVYLVLLVSATGIYLWSVWTAQRRAGVFLIGAGGLTFGLLLFALVR